MDCRAQGGSAAENLALQNIQARLRMVIAFLLAQVRAVGGMLLGGCLLGVEAGPAGKLWLLLGEQGRWRLTPRPRGHRRGRLAQRLVQQVVCLSVVERAVRKQYCSWQD